MSALFHEWYPFSFLDGVTSEGIAKTPDDLQEGDVLIVWGGEDISPSLYNKPKTKFTYASSSPSSRDQKEWDLMKRAVELKIPIIGVCRGAQMLCALAGGTLYQDVRNHAGPNHFVHTKHGEKVLTNSLHHQMMCIENTNHILEAWTEGRSPFYVDVNAEGEVFNNRPEVDPELVLFPDVKGMAIQWHPEMSQMDQQYDYIQHVCRYYSFF